MTDISTAARTAPILLTGFEPFGGETLNPSWEAVRRLDGHCIGGHPVTALALPVAFGAAVRQLDEALSRLRPAIVLAVGQAGGRARLSLERVAINLVDARIPDNDGEQPIDCPVIASAPPAYFSNLPVKAMRAAIETHGIPAELSHTAGTYVCNALFFGLMHSIAAAGGGIRGGFMHLPWLPEQALAHPGEPSLPLEQMVRGIGCALDAAVRHGDDLPVSGGTTH